MSWIKYILILMSLATLVLVILIATGTIKVEMKLKSTMAAAVSNTCGACSGGTCCQNGDKMQCCAGVANGTCCEDCPGMGCCPDGWVCDCANKRCVDLRRNIAIPMPSLT